MVFQSTLPRGERLHFRSGGFLDHKISIHAPARGATRIFRIRGNFFLFQSTLPRGERPTESSFRMEKIYFNPRSREGSDAKQREVKTGSVISIHAPARGATGCTGNGKCSTQISIHAPARGATSGRLLYTILFLYFNPRSREGSD